MVLVISSLHVAAIGGEASTATVGGEVHTASIGGGTHEHIGCFFIVSPSWIYIAQLTLSSI